MQEVGISPKWLIIIHLSCCHENYTKIYENSIALDQDWLRVVYIHFSRVKYAHHWYWERFEPRLLVIPFKTIKYFHTPVEVACTPANYSPPPRKGWNKNFSREGVGVTSWLKCSSRPRIFKNIKNVKILYYFMNLGYF